MNAFKLTSLRELYLASGLLAAVCVLVFAPDAYLIMLARSGMRIGALLLLPLVLWCLWQRKMWCFGASGMAMVFILAFAQVPVHEPTTHEGHGLRVAHFNVLQPNARRADVVAAIKGTKADLVSVQEVDEAWSTALINGLGREFPHHRVVPRSDCYGIALFSRRPFERVNTLEAQGTPFIEAVLRVEDELVRLLVVYATSPTGHPHHQRRNAQLRELATRLADRQLPTVLIGDLNTVHWDEAFRTLCAGSGARPVLPVSARTWPAWAPLALIPLDHVLLSPGMGCSSLALCDIPGSDHRGLVAELFPTAP